MINELWRRQHVWDQLDLWHSRLAELEVEAQDLEKPEDAAAVTERLTEVQQLHSQLAKQAELRTALIGKVRAETGSGGSRKTRTDPGLLVFLLRSNRGSRSTRR